MTAAAHPPRSLVPSVEQILASVEAEFGVPVRDILGKSRFMSIANARHIAIFCVRRLRGTSLPECARVFGLRDHTTPMYACAKLEALIAADAEMRGRVLRVELEATHRAQRAAHERGWA